MRSLLHSDVCNNSIECGEYQEHHSNGPVCFVCHLEARLPLLGSLKVWSLDLQNMYKKKSWVFGEQAAWMPSFDASQWKHTSLFGSSTRVFEWFSCIFAPIGWNGLPLFPNVQTRRVCSCWVEEIVWIQVRKPHRFPKEASVPALTSGVVS